MKKHLMGCCTILTIGILFSCNYNNNVIESSSSTVSSTISTESKGSASTTAAESEQAMALGMAASGRESYEEAIEYFTIGSEYAKKEMEKDPNYDLKKQNLLI